MLFRCRFWMSVAGLACVAIAYGASRAAEPGRAIKSDRGGWMVTTAHHRFEVFFYKTGLRIFPHDDADSHVPVSSLAGKMRISLPGGQRPLVYALKGAGASNGHEPDSLDLSADLSWVPLGKVKVEITITGLGDPREEQAAFEVPFVLVSPVRTAALVREYTFAVATLSDMRAIDEQGVCPVCGRRLSRVSQPIKVTKDNRDMFLDTENCAALFRKDPGRYFDTAARPVLAASTPSAPRYTYQAGYYGVGYYPSAVPTAAPAVSPVYATQREVPIERQAANPHWSFDYAEWDDHNL